METSKNVKFPYYSGNIKLTKVVGHVTLEDFVNAHAMPKQNTFDILEKVKAATEAGDITLKRTLKHQLYSFTPSVLIKVGVGRKYDNVDEWTGIMQLDFDGIETIEKAHNLKYYLFTTYQCVICTYFSPSGKGVKCLIRITKPRDKEHFKAIYKTIEKEFEQLGYFDTATKNGLLPLFLSIDTNIISRDFSEAVAWDLEDWTVPIKVNLASTPTSNFVPTARYETEDQYNYDKTIRIFTNRIDNIVDNGHPQVRTACLLLGSRASAGYITKAEAEQLAAMHIESNGYLSKNLQGYIDTSMWAIGEGYKSPKYYM
jgi:hypothetical protein